MISKDKISKRYYMIPDFTSEDLGIRKLNEKVVKIFSEFFFICLREINAKNLS